jgi:hypothetical protein
MCACGCGEPAPIAHQSDSKRGYVKGQPRRYRHGHHGRGKERPAEVRAKIGRFGSDHHAWKGPNAGYSAIHMWVRGNFEKRGVCALCGADQHTEWANLSGAYERVRHDWIELCRSCHRKRDKSIKNLGSHGLPTGS